MSIKGKMDKENVVHMHKGILFNIKWSKIVSFVETWMNLESVIESEVGQKEKNEYHIFFF